MDDDIYKTPESKLIDDHTKEQQVGKPLVLSFIQIFAWLVLLTHIASFEIFSAPYITKHMIIGFSIIASTILVFSVFILTTISGKHPNTIKRINLYLVWIFVIFTIKEVFRERGLYPPNPGLDFFEILGLSLVFLIPLLVTAALAIWLRKTNNVQRYIEHENRPPQLR